MSASKRAKRNRAAQAAEHADGRAEARRAYAADEPVCLSCTFSDSEQAIFDALDERAQDAMVAFRLKIQTEPADVIRGVESVDGGWWHISMAVECFMVTNDATATEAPPCPHEVLAQRVERDAVSYRPTAERFIWGALDADGATLALVVQIPEGKRERQRVERAWPNIEWQS